MGILISCAKLPQDAVRGARVVQMNGIVDEYFTPVRVKQVLLPHSNHFICNSRDLRLINTRPLPGDAELQAGELYFLLPISTLEENMSPSDIVSLASRLIAAAKKEPSKSARCGTAGTPAASLLGTDGSDDFKVSRDYLQKLLASGNCALHQNLYNDCDNDELKMAYRQHLAAKSKSWRPRLHTIEEACFVR
eukprot:Gb_05757 [translate_table: standard]